MYEHLSIYIYFGRRGGGGVADFNSALIIHQVFLRIHSPKFTTTLPQAIAKNHFHRAVNSGGFMVRLR